MTYLPVDQYGRIRLDALKEALCEDTILVSIMYVNNEVGSVQPIQEAASIVKAYNKDILFHVDAVQGFGKYKIYPKKLKVDMCSISGHKIHGPKGVGALYIGENVKIRPIVYGGGDSMTCVPERKMYQESQDFPWRQRRFTITSMKKWRRCGR